MPRTTVTREPHYPTTFNPRERESTVLYPVIRVRQSFASAF